MYLQYATTWKGFPSFINRYHGIHENEGMPDLSRLGCLQINVFVPKPVRIGDIPGYRLLLAMSSTCAEDGVVLVVERRRNYATHDRKEETDHWAFLSRAEYAEWIELYELDNPLSFPVPPFAEVPQQSISLYHPV